MKKGEREETRGNKRKQEETRENEEGGQKNLKGMRVGIERDGGRGERVCREKQGERRRKKRMRVGMLSHDHIMVETCFITIVIRTCTTITSRQTPFLSLTY